MRNVIAGKLYIGTYFIQHITLQLIYIQLHLHLYKFTKKV